MTATLCLDCGRVTRASRCPACRRARVRRYDAGRPASALYGSAEWRHLAASVTAGATSCFWCGRSGVRLVADHVVAVALMPALALDSANVVPACVSCNVRRGSAPATTSPQSRGETE